MGSTYHLSLEYPEMLALARMIHKELADLMRICDKYSRYSESGHQGDTWIEKLMQSKGQVEMLEKVQKQLSEKIAVCKIETMRI